MTAQTPEAELEFDETPADEPSLLPRVAAELFGTFVLVMAILFVTAFGTLGTQGATPLHIALAGGLALAAMVVAFGSVSGAHLNPAVSLGAAIAGRLSWADLLPYVVAQTLGAIAAGGLLWVITPSTLAEAIGMSSTRGFMSTTANGFGTHSPIAMLSGGQVTFSTAQALVLEAVATAVLVAVVLAATKRRHPGAPLAIGATMAVGILVALHVTNAAINPARATGIALFADAWAMQQLWLFWVAPLLGGAIAGLLALMIERSSTVPADWDEGDWDDDDEDDELQASAPAPAPAEASADDGDFDDEDDEDDDEVSDNNR